jgi:hypothetical protein
MSLRAAVKQFNLRHGISKTCHCESRACRGTDQAQDKEVFLFAGIFGQDASAFGEIAAILERKFSRVSKRSNLFDFIHTDYYTDEMGGNLKKMFFVFEKPVSPESLIAIKLYTGKLEAKFSTKKDTVLKRRVNLDPGYISMSKVVLASTKNYSHRLYLGKGIYGEVTLSFKDKSYRPFPWTFPDYRTPEYINFFNETRKMCYNR